VSEDPPEWLSSTVTCKSVGGSLVLSEDYDSVRNSTKIVKYNSFSNTSRLIIEFAIENQAAKTCSDEGGK